MKEKEYADILMKRAWRKIDLAHDMADPLLHEHALNLMRKADSIYESIGL